MHLTIFWGMIALFIGTIVATIDWDVAHLIFNVQFLTGWVYVLFELILDISLWDEVRGYSIGIGGRF